MVEFNANNEKREIELAQVSLWNFLSFWQLDLGVFQAGSGRVLSF